MIDCKGIALLASCAVGLAACGSSEEAASSTSATGNKLSEIPTARATAERETRDAPAVIPADNLAADQNFSAPLPPAAAELRFVGSWAAEASYCADKAWQFTRTSLRTPAGSACTFKEVKPVAGGYDIAARCTAEGPPNDDVLEIRFAESAQAMLFKSRTIAGAGLIHCAS